MNLKVGEWVEVRSKEEVLRTLDAKGQYDGMPFMPEMFAFCGLRFRVHKRAHKTCDTVFPIRGRRVDEAVHLETRCDGSAHGGCQAACLLFWKEQWLKPITGNEVGPPEAQATRLTEPLGSDESRVWDATRVGGAADLPVRYSCQATQLPYMTKDLAWWDIRQYLEDYVSGNVSLWRMLCGAVYSAYYHVGQAGIGLGRPMRWVYDRFDRPLRNRRHPRSTGVIPEQEPTPRESLNLQPGEWVRVKSHDQILATLNSRNLNRGLYWDAEMVPYCGGTYKVLSRVSKILNEKTGEMQEMKNPCIILDTVVCQARYSHCRMFCPRSIYPYWREIWLERVESLKS